MFTLHPIGIIQNTFDTPVSPNEIKQKPSTLIIEEKYAEALYNIELCSFIDIVFYFHKTENSRLKGNIFTGEERGVFASRSPSRPNGIGITTVKLLKRNGNILLVEGLDAINNTPILDIKSVDTSLFAKETSLKELHESVLKTNPRIEHWNNILAGDTDSLLLNAAQLHGHFCPGLAMGIMASVYAMQKLKPITDGMEDVLAIVETNNCFSDGVQFVTGCSFGNNALIFKDLGKTAFTLTQRDGKGIRVISLPESQAYIQTNFPEFTLAYEQVVVQKQHDTEIVARFKKLALERAFATLKLPFDKLFAVSEVLVSVPDYAPSTTSVVCAACGESAMSSRTIKRDNSVLCYACAKHSYNSLDGGGIKCSEKI